MHSLTSIAQEEGLSFFNRVRRVLDAIKGRQLNVDQIDELCREWATSGNSQLEAIASVIRGTVRVQYVYCWGCCGITKCLVVEDPSGEPDPNADKGQECRICTTCHRAFYAQMMDGQTVHDIFLMLEELRECAKVWNNQAESGSFAEKEALDLDVATLFETTMEYMRQEQERTPFVSLMNLSVSAQLILREMKIETVESLCELTERDLRENGWFQEDALQSIRAALRLQNRALKGEALNQGYREPDA